MQGLSLFALISIILTANGSTDIDRWRNSERDLIDKIIRTMPLDNIVLLFDNTTGLFASDVLQSDSGDKKARTYLPINVDLMTSNGFMDYITRLSQGYIGRCLHFIVMLDDTKVITIIEQINYIDENSRKSTNIRHWSTWVIFHYLQVYKTLENLVDKFNNMVVVHLRNKREGYLWSCDVMTLVMTKNGVKFYPVDMSRSVLQLFPNFYYGYNGRHIDVIVKTWRSFIEEHEINGTLVYTGYLVDILDAIARKHNFTYSMYNDRKSSWNGNVNGTNTGINFKILNGKYDIMAAPSIMAEGRTEFMDYVLPAYLSDKVIPTYKKRPDSSLLLYTKPFQIAVLVSILGCFICVCCILSTTENYNPYNPKYKQKGSVKARIFHVVGITLNQGGILKIDSLTGQLTVLSFWFFCIIIGSVYRANLVAFFTYSKPADEFNSLEDILHSDYQVATVGSTAMLETFENHSLPVYKKLLDVFKTKSRLYPETMSTDNDVHIAQLLAGNYVYLSASSSSSFAYANNCDIIRFHTPVYDYIFAFGVPKNSPLKYDMENAMYQLQNSGVLDRWQKKWWPERRKGFCDASSGVKQLHLSDIYSIFILMAVCLALCFFVLSVEVVGARKQGTGSITRRFVV